MPTGNRAGHQPERRSVHSTAQQTTAYCPTCAQYLPAAEPFNFGAVGRLAAALTCGHTVHRTRTSFTRRDCARPGKGRALMIDVPDDETAKMWAGRIAEACGWPHEVRRFKPRPQQG